MPSQIIGLDISSKSTGWGIIDTDFQLIDYGIIQFDDNKNLGEKLVFFDMMLSSVFSTYQPQWIGIEDVYCQNIVTMKTLSRFAGVTIKCICERYNIGLCYSSKTIGKALTTRRKKLPQEGIAILTSSEIVKLVGLKGGLKREDKKNEVLSWVNHTFNKSFELEENDITDAIVTACATINLIKSIKADYWEGEEKWMVS